MDFVPDFVNKVFNNLLSNALKFTPEYGKIIVAMWREGSNLLIEVSDTGEGMDKETANNVFNPFYQGVTDSMNIGTGIGLALVKQVIDSLNGKINVRSREGYGTTFHIEIPIINECNVKLNEQPMDNTPVLPTEEKILIDTDAEDNQYTMLVIEDNRDIATYIGEVLSERYAVAYATNGEDGWQKAINLVPDLIFLDHMMPEMDGLETLEHMKNLADNPNAQTPVIMLTANAIVGAKEEYIEAGFTDYLTKPIRETELLEMILKYLPEELVCENGGQGIEKSQDAQDYIQDILEPGEELELYRCPEGTADYVVYKIYPRDTDVIIGYTGKKFAESLDNAFHRIWHNNNPIKFKYYPDVFSNVFVDSLKTCIAVDADDLPEAKHFGELAMWQGFSICGFAYGSKNSY